MTAQKYPVVLSKVQTMKLRDILKKGTHPAQVANRARILLKAHAKKPISASAKEIGVVNATVINVKRRFFEEGLERALYDAPRTGQPKILTGGQEAKIVAIACTKAPDGFGKWTLDLLEKKICKDVKVVGRTTIYNVLLRNKLKPWREKNVVHF